MNAESLVNAETLPKKSGECVQMRSKILTKAETVSTAADMMYSKNQTL